MAGEVSAEKSVFKILDGYVSLSNGNKLPVSAFSLHLQHNGIPTLRINTVPALYEKGENTSATGKAYIAKLTDFIRVYNSAQAMMENTSKRNASFYFKMASNFGESQELNLKDWIMTGVGFGGLSASGAMQLSLELQHPVRQINECAVNLFANHSDGQRGPAQLGAQANVCDGLKSALDEYLKRGTESKPAYSVGAYSIMLEKLKTAITVYPDVIKWVGKGGWPIVSEALSPFIPFTIWNYVWGVNSVTLWDLVSHQIMDQWFLQMAPTYWLPYVSMSAFRPWSKPEFIVTEADVSDMTLPPADGQPVCGAVCLADSPIISSYTVCNDVNAMASAMSDGLVYMEAVTFPGAVLQMRPPDWFFYAIRDSAGLNIANSGMAQAGDANGLAGNSGSSKAGLGNLTSTDLASVGEGLSRIAVEYFVETFRRNYEVNLKCRFMLKANGKYLCPGANCQFNSIDGKTFLNFFVTGVVHTVDCVGKQASTQLDGSYLSRIDGPSLKAIPAGIAPNYLYDGQSAPK